MKGGFTSKSPALASLKLKAVARCWDPKLLEEAIRYYLGVEDVNTKVLCVGGLQGVWIHQT